MLPKYVDFPKDLRSLKEKIEAARQEFNEFFTRNTPDKKYRTIYNSMNQTFAAIQDAISKLENSNLTTIERDTAWDALQLSLNSADNDFPVLSFDASKEQKDDLNSKLGNETYRQLWSVGKKLYSFGLSTKVMQSKDKLDKVSDELDSYEKVAKDFTEEVNAVPRRLNYENSVDMINQQKSADEALKSSKQEYEEYQASCNLRQLEQEAHEAEIDYIQNYQIEANLQVAMQNEYEHLKDKINVFDNLMDELYDRKDKLNAEEQKIEDQITKTIDPQIEKLQKQVADKVSGLSNTNGVKDELETIRDESLQKIIGFSIKKSGANISRRVENETQKYADLLLKERDMVTLLDDFNRFREKNIKELGSTEELDVALKNGKSAQTLTKNILDSFREMKTGNMKTIVRNYDLYQEFNAFKNRFSSIMQNNQKALNDIAALESAEAFGTYANNEFKNIEKADNAMYNLNTKAWKNETDQRDYKWYVNQLKSSYQSITYKSEKVQSSDSGMKKIQEEIDALKADLNRQFNKKSELIEEAEEINYDNQMMQLVKEKNEVVSQKEEMDKNILRQETKVNALIYKKEDTHAALETVKEKLSELETAQKENQKQYDVVCDDVNHFDRVRAKSQDLKNAHDTIRLSPSLKLNMNNKLGNNDLVSEMLSSLGTNLFMFNSNIESHKRNGHKNSDEFKDMMTALSSAYEATEINHDMKVKSLSSLESYREKMKKVRDFAQTYLDKKNNEHGVLIPSSQRKYRLSFAKRLIEFSENAMKDLAEVSEIVKNTNQRIQNSGVTFMEMPNDDRTIFNIINANADAKEKAAEKTEKEMIRESNLNKNADRIETRDERKEFTRGFN